MFFLFNPFPLFFLFLFFFLLNFFSLLHLLLFCKLSSPLVVFLFFFRNSPPPCVRLVQLLDPDPPLPVLLVQPLELLFPLVLLHGPLDPPLLLLLLLLPLLGRLRLQLLHPLLVRSLVHNAWTSNTALP